MTVALIVRARDVRHRYRAMAFAVLTTAKLTIIYKRAIQVAGKDRP